VLIIKEYKNKNLIQNDMTIGKIIFIYPDPLKGIIYPPCVSMIKEYKNKF